MLHSVINSFLPSISALSFADKVGGIVYPLQKQIIDKDNQAITKIFPVYGNDPSVCESGTYIEMTPNSNLKSVIYFEATQEAITEGGCGDQFMSESTVMLIAWFNLAKINSTLRSGESMLRILARTINGNHNILIGTTQVHAVITLSNMNFRDPAAFGKYEPTYREANKQYLIYPHDFGSLTFNVQLNYGLCDEEPIINPVC